ncbi:MAG: ATP-binding protein [Desulfobacterales bacterium]|nr:ATP-binding protein [Desulfobacterales bacterium]
MPQIKRKHIGLSLPPWMIIGTTVILLVIVVVMAVSNYNREKGYMADILLEKGAALIKAFEAGTRTGMMSMSWGGGQVQQLLEEIARQPDILYLAVTDAKGRILAHNDAARIEKSFSMAFEKAASRPARSAQWRLTTAPDGTPAFEVYRYFKPFSADECRMMQNSACCGPENHRGAWCAPGRYATNDQIIFIGFDRTHFIEARQEDLRNTAIISSILVMLGFAGFITMFVTQNYRATRRRLQDTSAVAEEVIANLPVGLLVMDYTGRVILENTAAASITGRPTMDIRGKPAARILPDTLIRLIDTLQTEAPVIEREVKCRFGDQEPVSLSVSAARIVNADGVFIGSLMILRDLTEIKDLQQAVQRQEKLAAIGGLAAGIAHEIRNPLSSVKGMATYFKNRFSDDPEAGEAASVMVSETDRLNRVISELLEFARPSEINARPTDINTVLAHAIRLIKADADEHHIRLRLITDDDLPPADIDGDRFIQCLLNLYLNGIQAMETGGELTVKSQPAKEGGVDIQVADTGPGISEKHLNQIFDPYFTTKSTGTGLGLAIVHKIVENHGGRISVKNDPGEGTVFTIRLPESRAKNSNEDQQ